METFNAYANLPEECRPLPVLPALEGSEKQVAWAEKIRDNALDEVEAELCNRYQGIVEVITSRDDMAAFLDDTKTAFSAGGTSEKIVNERLSCAVANMKNACADYNKIVEMANIPSAKFWIDTKKSASATPFRDYIFGKKDIYAKR